MPTLSFPTTLGDCRVTWNDAGLTGFSLPTDVASDAPTRPPRPRTAQRLVAPAERPAAKAAAEPTSAPNWVRELVAKAQAHLAGQPQHFDDVPLDWSRVSAFQRGVYEQTQAIKPGTTASYGDIARALQSGPEGARAVGVALGSNPWPLIVPCHRVVAANGRMTGFSAPGGVRTKTRLLALEGAELPLG